MFKSVLVAAAILISSPTFVFSQDISFLFGGGLPQAGGGPATSTFVSDGQASSGSVNIYSNLGFDFDAGDLNFFSSNTSVASITGGETFNLSAAIGARFDRFDLTVEADGSEGNLFSVSILNFGIDQALVQFDPYFDSTVGLNGSFLLARVDFDIVGTGTAEFSFGLGELGFIELPANALTPTFGTATLEVIPEPSSAIVLMVGCVAVVARRKRA